MTRVGLDDSNGACSLGVNKQACSNQQPPQSYDLEKTWLIGFADERHHLGSKEARVIPGVTLGCSQRCLQRKKVCVRGGSWWGGGGGGGDPTPSAFIENYALPDKYTKYNTNSANIA